MFDPFEFDLFKHLWVNFFEKFVIVSWRFMPFPVYSEEVFRENITFVHTNDWLAIRKLNTDLKNPNSEIVLHSGDFALYYIGAYDSKSACITTDNPPKFVEEISTIIKSGG